MMSDFRPALWIELHDVNIVLGQSGAELGWFWHWFDHPNSLKTRFYIKGRDIAALCEIAGLNFESLSHFLDSTAEKNLKKQKTYYETVDSYEFKIYDGEPVEISSYKELFARVDSAHLLSIKAVSVGSDETSWTDEFTYSGSFTIQWDSEVDTGQNGA